MLTVECNRAPDIIPLSFKKAIMEPEKVIAPTAAPMDISIKLANLILPIFPRLKASGFKKAAIATNTAASPTNYESLQLIQALQSLEF